VQEAVSNPESYLDKHGKGIKLLKSSTAPWPNNYVSELDDSRELSPKLAAHYQSLIGILHWIMELVWVDMIVGVSTLPSHMTLPREVHLEAVYNVLAYLKRCHNSRLVFDPSFTGIYLSSFVHHDWREFYGDVKEAIPHHAPKPRGKDVDLRMYVESDHAGDKQTRRSRSGLFVYMNISLIFCLSKKQSTIDTSLFGAKFVAIQAGMETLRGLRYKLQMMGVAHK
jgi:hypothetical protein